MNSLEILKKLTDGEGVSGNEKSLSYASELLNQYCDVTICPNGNILGTVGSGDKTILLDAHLDRIGLIVTAVDDSGFLRVDKCGGCDVRVLCASEVTVWGKKPIKGIITSTPPHLSAGEDSSKAPSMDGIFVDTGTSDAKKYISVGDRITIDAPVIPLNNDLVTGAALDDRIGVLALLEVLEILKDKKLNTKVCVMFSAQEETTEAGAKTGAFEVMPDEAISVDVSFASAPGIAETKCGKLNEGAMICISPAISRDMSDKLIEVANKNGIKHQLEVCASSTGTNADVISVSGKGIKTGLVSIPLRNMHTAIEVASLSDVKAVAEVIASYILEMEA